MVRSNNTHDDLSEQLSQKLGVRGKTLAKKLKRAGRRLPRAQRKAGQVITDAQEQKHPLLKQLVDQKEVRKAEKSVAQFLEGVDRSENRKSMWLGILGGIVFNLILIVLLLGIILRWRGFI